MVFRVVPNAIRSIADLGLPDVVRELAERERGIVLVTGTTGCGKSTTLAAMIEHVNNTACKHIITVEDPIEYLHGDRLCAIDQREVGSDTESFEVALRRVLRQDPDVILIGEMRDETNGARRRRDRAPSALDSAFAGRTRDDQPDSRLLPARPAVAGATDARRHDQGHPLPTARAKGRRGRSVAIAEILTMTGRAHDMILDPDRTGQLTEVIEQGEYYGMQTFDQALYRTIEAGQVTLEDALRHATRPPARPQAARRLQGHGHTTMEDLEQPASPAASVIV
ncbi:MAG TPA: ATPase, T2SS/T4P/T4SS family [Solirubrobacteraceae bacterium]|nr:ATPase, T2SS/T4P/T4SS family [Solirubrobacteraceae bacterium]